MRSYILAICTAAFLTLPAAAAPSEAGSDDASLLQLVHSQYYRGGHWGSGANCRELRRACMYKRELGEEGMGNCQRYRELCR
ncbi:hypothetical protein OGR47_17755 [Methylocystis sp. MJC1]|jgi:hypothetical protein|uniref:hypothetical protein n=1 Tax=Methylocystis sp. MJC1 TaxID=2654282 RepID=UPI0013EE20D4|nr:hypothetical protein [Methylocystis sp. MJC1]KAF2989990.1 hypothetical protein MJC1_02907 [Methylocystis sp. MJC1]MBU6528804.1 hypothetical protein [Methylocystis sp. MJC1]UZX11689.1 hypothetical protein OGR47_17755 [Methylocystis sp. MJC1]